MYLSMCSSCCHCYTVGGARTHLLYIITKIITSEEETETQDASTCNQTPPSDIKQHHNCVTLWIKYHEVIMTVKLCAVDLIIILNTMIFVHNSLYLLWNLLIFKCLKKNALNYNTMCLFTLYSVLSFDVSYVHICSLIPKYGDSSVLKVWCKVHYTVYTRLYFKVH